MEEDDVGYVGDATLSYVTAAWIKAGIESLQGADVKNVLLNEEQRIHALEELIGIGAVVFTVIKDTNLDKRLLKAIARLEKEFDYYGKLLRGSCIGPFQNCVYANTLFNDVPANDRFAGATDHYISSADISRD
jgi:hypothetical protein